MALPYIQGWGGMPVSNNNAVVSAALAARGIISSLGSGLNIVEHSGKKWFRNAGSSSGTTYVQLGDLPSSIWIGMRFANPIGNAVVNRYKLLNESTALSFGINNTGNFRAFRDATGTANDINISVPFWSSSVYIEMFISNTLLEVYVDGELTPSATATYASLVPRRLDLSSDNTTHTMDSTDIYVSETRLGEGNARLLPVTTVVSNTGTVTGAADAAEALSAIGDNSKYVTYEPTQKTLLNHTGISDNPSEIKVVQLTSVGKKSGTALLSEKIIIKTASETVVETPTLSMGNTIRNTSLLADPHDNSAWTKAKINSMTFGVGSE